MILDFSYHLRGKVQSIVLLNMMNRCNTSFFISLWNAITSLCTLPSMAKWKKHLFHIKVYLMASCSLFFGSVSSIIQWWATWLGEMSADHFVLPRLYDCTFLFTQIELGIDSVRNDKVFYRVNLLSNGIDFKQSEYIWPSWVNPVYPRNIYSLILILSKSNNLTLVVKLQSNVAFSKVF